MIDRYSLPDMKKIWSEENKYDIWLKIELAICEAWFNEGVIPENDIQLLRGAQYDKIKLEEIFARTRHDMTAFTRSITENLGPEGRWIHLGVTSSDILDTSLALQMAEAGKILDNDITDMIEVLTERSLEFKHTPMIGRTHGVHAEPTSFGLKLALWREELIRNRERLLRARNEISVGKISGAVGTYATLSPFLEETVCGILGIKAAPLSNQIIQRDRHAQFVTTLALIASSLEKFATEVRHLQRTEVRELEEPFGEGQTGSSAMPHKRNPELSERVCGLARLIRGYSTTALENVALWHERDISHSSAERLIIPDACLALDYVLNIFTEVLRGMKVYTENMLNNLESTKGLFLSQRVMLTLIEKGMSRENAYSLVQSHALKSWDTGDDFRDLLRKDDKVESLLNQEDLAALFDYQYYLRHVDDIFDRLGL